MDSGPSAALARFQEAFLQFAGSFEPKQLSRQERQRALEVLAQAEKALTVMGAMIASLMANEPAGPYGWVRPMDVQLVTNRCASLWGVTSVTAAKAIETGSQVVAQPELTQAALAGQLSMTQVALLSDAVKKAPGSASFLLATARCRNVRGLAAECQRVKAHEEGKAGGPANGAEADDGSSGEGPSTCRRRLRSWVDEHGTWHLAATGTRADGELVMCAIRRLVPGIIEPSESAAVAGEHLFGGLVALAEAAVRDASSPGAALSPVEQDFVVHRTGGRTAPQNWGRRPKAEPPLRPLFPLDGLDWLFAPLEDDS